MSALSNGRCRPALHRPCRPRGGVLTLTDPWGWHFFKLVLTHTADPIRPTRRSPDPNRPTRRAIFLKTWRQRLCRPADRVDVVFIHSAATPLLFCTPTRTLRSTNQFLLDVPRFSIEDDKRSFSYLAPTLSLNITFSPTFDTFKRHLQTHFFK